MSTRVRSGIEALSRKLEQVVNSELSLEKLTRDFHLTVGAINKWVESTFSGAQDHGIVDCPLCRRYYRTYRAGCSMYLHDWYGCPIEYIGSSLGKCERTPYMAWAYWFRLSPKKVCNEKTYELALTELRFLIGIAHELAGKIERRLERRSV